jgi:diacylglycerol kinase (ATP)
VRGAEGARPVKAAGVGEIASIHRLCYNPDYMSDGSRDKDLPTGVRAGVAVIVNPAAGRGQAGRQGRAIRALLGAAADGWTWYFTQGRGDAERMAREAATGGASMVVAVGGDGTVHETANGILGSGAVLGLIPFGTGNDLARALDLHNDLPAACRAVTDGDVLPVDVGVIEGAGTGGKRHFLVLAGTGFDARTAQTVNNGIRWLSGAPAYVWGAVVTLARFEPFDLTLTVDNGLPRRTRAMFVSIANGPMTGGGMRIAPDARLDDGRFDICLAAEVSKATLLYQLTQVFQGAHVKHPAVTMLRATSAEIDADPPQPLLVDGEVIGTTPARISILPGALPIKVRKRAGNAI